MRLLHTSDWHLGRTLYGEDLLTHQAAFLDWLLAEAVAREVHAVVVAGDIYDRAVPTTDAVAVLDVALRGFAAASIPVLLTSGNHDSAVRLGFGSRLSELAGVHLRTDVAEIARPVLLSDEHGDVALYGIPYLLPDAVMADLGAERSHASVLSAATRLIKADAGERGIARTVVAAHAFVTGAVASDSERDIRVGGIGDAPASLFAGLTYVALGHLHGQQDVNARAEGATVRYCGSPLAFSFSERHHNKSVTLAEMDGAGNVAITKLATPVPRPLREVRGRLADLLAGSLPAARGGAAGTGGTGGTGSRAAGGGVEGIGDDLAGAWVKVVLTDTVRPAAPMERLREKWPHTLVLDFEPLDFEPEGELASVAADLRRLKCTVDPAEICELFVEYTSGGPADAGQRRVLRDVVEAARRSEDGDDRAAGAVVRTDGSGLADLADVASVDEWLANACDTQEWVEAELAFPGLDAGGRGTKRRRGGSRGGNPAAA